MLKREAGGKCSRCGYDKCMAALDFHHLDPNTKDKIYGSVPAMLRNCSIERAREEAAKCILLCANCHREEHNLIDA